MTVLVGKRTLRAAMVLFLMLMSATSAFAWQLDSSQMRTDRELFPPVSALPEQEALPDPFLRLDGTRVETFAEWRKQREIG